MLFGGGRGGGGGINGYRDLWQMISDVYGVGFMEPSKSSSTPLLVSVINSAYFFNSASLYQTTNLERTESNSSFNSSYCSLVLVKNRLNQVVAGHSLGRI